MPHSRTTAQFMAYTVQQLVNPLAYLPPKDAMRVWFMMAAWSSSRSEATTAGWLDASFTFSKASKL
jgi:hypothetical protein